MMGSFQKSWIAFDEDGRQDGNQRGYEGIKLFDDEEIQDRVSWLYDFDMASVNVVEAQKKFAVE